MLILLSEIITNNENGILVENQNFVIQAIREFGFSNATPALLQEPDAMLRMGVPPLRLEVMKSISGVSFEDCWPRRVVIEDEGLEIPMISR